MKQLKIEPLGRFYCPFRNDNKPCPDNCSNYKSVSSGIADCVHYRYRVKGDKEELKGLTHLTKEEISKILGELRDESVED